ncbi:MAG: hypothetical protein ABR567_09490 [Myxococcales bacterium]
MKTPTHPPLSARASPPARTQYDVLVEGYPDFLRPAIEVWLYDDVGLSDREGRDLVNAFVRDFIVWRRKPLPEHFSVGGSHPAHDLMLTMAENEEFALDLLDYAVSTIESVRESLENILRLGGSAYMVDPTGTCGLTKRVPDAAVEELQAALEPKTRAAEHLALAWSQLYGRAPNASSAYREAVRAVEVLACPVIIPHDPKGTLGKVVGVLKDAPDKLRTVFTDGKAEGARTASEMMRLLWHAQHDRHGDPDVKAPMHVSDEEARGAVHLAVLLVTWFHQQTLTAAP